MEILYIKGDATAPIGSGVKVITHICNDIGGWGKGFVLALSKKMENAGRSLSPVVQITGRIYFGSSYSL